ncbi:MAG: NAD(P)-dependent oxidoreductase [Gammaproteobacteria bacterium]|jgi:nucleoside-diphosphate-sugar epimerase|nr:NAD(P)-dependent oxidoreductase [Gammaproteobacteria bacterium]
MKILFTGGSSFTGCWFIRELARAGHEVVATFRQRPDDYDDPLRRERVALALEHADGVFDCSFGDERFAELAGNASWDLLCHHAADVTNYKSDDFDVDAALAANTRNLAGVLAGLKNGCSTAPAVLLTGSVFENDEGRGAAGETDLQAFSPYGLSKGLTYQVFRYHCKKAGLRLGKFVIPNPFGPLEEPRFTAYLMRNWFADATPSVNTPDYVRDNVHISLLAAAYRHYAEQLVRGEAAPRFNPSGYVETQGEFAERFAAAMRERLGLPCKLDLRTQTDFGEPLQRVNTDTLDPTAFGWDEAGAWDAVASYYKAKLQA